MKNAEIVKSVDPSLDVEAVSVISSLPKWKPATQGAKPVSTTYDFPVIFQLIMEPTDKMNKARSITVCVVDPE